MSFQVDFYRRVHSVHHPGFVGARSAPYEKNAGLSANVNKDHFVRGSRECSIRSHRSVYRCHDLVQIEKLIGFGNYSPKTVKMVIPPFLL